MSIVRWLSIVVLVPMFLVICTGCPPSKTSTTTAAALAAPATLIDDDSHVAVWMTLDNWHVDAPGTVAVCKEENATDTMKFGVCNNTYADPHAELRPGVLFQIGTLMASTGKEDDFDYVQLTMKDGKVDKLYRSDFDWLDVSGSGRSCTIDPLYAYSMLLDPKPLVKTECDGATLFPVGTPTTCLRERGIQAGLVPNVALITYWPGPAFYTMAMSTNKHHHIYTFSLGDSITVDRWLSGCYKGRYNNVIEILIHNTGSSDHEGFPHQPMNGGKLIVQ